MFRLGQIHLFQLLFSAGVRNDLPLTREWMHTDSPGLTGSSFSEQHMLKGT